MSGKHEEFEHSGLYYLLVILSVMALSNGVGYYHYLQVTTDNEKMNPWDTFEGTPPVVFLGNIKGDIAGPIDDGILVLSDREPDNFYAVTYYAGPVSGSIVAKYWQVQKRNGVASAIVRVTDTTYSPEGYTFESANSSGILYEKIQYWDTGTAIWASIIGVLSGILLWYFFLGVVWPRIHKSVEEVSRS